MATGIRAQRHDLARRQILDAAWSLAEQSGIAGVSFREVARQVGMRAPSLYTYFASKDDLFDAMFVEGYLALEASGAEWSATVAEMEPVDAIAFTFERWIAFCQASIARYQIMFTRAIPGWSPTTEAYAVSMRQYGSMVEALGRVGVAGEEAVDLYVSIAAGLAAQQLANDPTGDRYVARARAAARMLVDHMERSAR